MKAKILSIAVLAVTAALPAHAQSQGSGWYGEVGYLAMSMKDDYPGGSTTATPGLARFVIGKELGSNIAAEAMYGTTIQKDTGSTAKVSDSFTAIYVKPFTNLSDSTQIFARLGYANNQAKSERSSGTTETWSSSKPSYGFGVQTQFNKDIYGAIDYMDYGKKTFDAPYSGETIKYSGFTLSVGMRF